MFFSKIPKVLGLVNIIAAVFSLTTRFKSSISTSPRSFDLTVTALKPANDADAGFVPWAESGTITSSRWPSPLSKWYALKIIKAVHSPWAPAAGCNVTSSIPVISLSSSCKLYTISKEPWTCPSSCKGCDSANPGMRATFSLILGLYFIVHDPSG